MNMQSVLTSKRNHLTVQYMLGMSVGSGSGVVGTTGKGESWLLEGIKVIGQCRFYS